MQSINSLWIVLVLSFRSSWDGGNGGCHSRIDYSNTCRSHVDSSVGSAVLVHGVVVEERVGVFVLVPVRTEVLVDEGYDNCRKQQRSRGEILSNPNGVDSLENFVTQAVFQKIYHLRLCRWTS